MGGLLAAPEDKTALLQDLVQHANDHGLDRFLLQHCDDELPLFKESGFQATKWGEDAWIDLSRHTWRGKAFEVGSQAIQLLRPPRHHVS